MDQFAEPIVASQAKAGLTRGPMLGLTGGLMGGLAVELTLASVSKVNLTERLRPGMTRPRAILRGD